MAKKALIVSAILLSIVIIVCIIISIVSLANKQPIEYQRVVAYDSNYNLIVETHNETESNNNELTFLTNLLKHERIIMATSFIIVILFAILFYGAKRSKS